jgi:hypothetical protein
MVAAAAHSEALPSKPFTDAELIAEIAPAMLDKLRSAKRTWRCIIMLGFCLLLVLHHDYIPDTAFVFSAIGLACLWFVIPEYFAKQQIAIEVAYRRQHGKWRWDH